MQNIVDSFRRAENYFFSSISCESLLFGDDAKVYMTKIATADLNTIYTRRDCDLKNILSLAISFCNAENLPFALTIFEQLNFSQVDRLVAMSLNFQAHDVDKQISGSNIDIRLRLDLKD